MINASPEWVLQVSYYIDILQHGSHQIIIFLNQTYLTVFVPLSRSSITNRLAIYQFKMVLMQLGGLAACLPINVAAVYAGSNTGTSEDRDCLLPITSIYFTFYPLIISLPEAHFKLIRYTMEQEADQQAMNEEEYFPYAFLACLLSVTACMFVDKFMLKKCDQDQDQEKQEDHHHSSRVIGNSNGLLFLLSLSIVLQNFVNYFYICVQPNDTQILKETILFLIFTSFLNFCFGYLLGQAGVSKKTIFRYGIFINCGLVVGFLLSFIFEPDVILLILPCICAGIQLYCSIFICFPTIFTNGEKSGDDRSRFSAIIVAFLLTVIYYPACYFLRI